MTEAPNEPPEATMRARLMRALHPFFAIDRTPKGKPAPLPRDDAHRYHSLVAPPGQVSVHTVCEDGRPWIDRS